MIAKVGNDIFGKETVSSLNKAGVNTSSILVSDSYPSGVALINVDEKGENSISVASGANGALSPSDIEAAAAEIAEAGIVLMQLETPVETITRAAEIAKQHGVTVVLNPAPAPVNPLPDNLLKNIDIIIPNKTEAESLTGVIIDTPGREHIAGTILASKGIPTTVITLGSRGAVVCQGEKQERIEPFKVKAIDTTAAGDTFCGAFCVAYTEGKSTIESLNFAKYAAAISVTRIGAQQSCPSRDEVESLIKATNAS